MQDHGVADGSTLALATARLAIEPIDREMILLRHFERLSHREAAANKRYERALTRLEAILRELGVCE